MAKSARPPLPPHTPNSVPAPFWNSHIIVLQVTQTPPAPHHTHNLSLSMNSLPDFPTWNFWHHFYFPSPPLSSSPEHIYPYPERAVEAPWQTQPELKWDVGSNPAWATRGLWLSGVGTEISGPFLILIFKDVWNACSIHTFIPSLAA